jgi:pimeloyl-ACP methyl ester carboxylesterase
MPGAWEYALDVVRYWRDDLRHLEAHYAHISVPTLLVWGDRDVVVQTGSAARLQKAIPGAELEIITGAGHLPYEECPEEFNRILLRFLIRS